MASTARRVAGSGGVADVSAAEMVDRLTVGRLVSLIRLQGCREYSKINSDRVFGNLRELRARPAAEFKEELRSFWDTVRRGLKTNRKKRRRRRGGSRGRSGATSSSRDEGRGGMRAYAEGRGKSPRRGRSRRRSRSQRRSPALDCDSDGAEGLLDPNWKSELEKFIMENEVDSNAAKALRKSPRDAQLYAMSCGNLRSKYNPSSALMKRLLDFRDRFPQQVSYPLIPMLFPGAVTAAAIMPPLAIAQPVPSISPTAPTFGGSAGSGSGAAKADMPEQKHSSKGPSSSILRGPGSGTTRKAVAGAAPAEDESAGIDHAMEWLQSELGGGHGKQE